MKRRQKTTPAEARRTLLQPAEQFGLPAGRAFKLAAAAVASIGVAYVTDRTLFFFLGIAAGIMSVFVWFTQWHTAVVGSDGLLLQRRSGIRFVPWMTIDKALYGKDMLVLRFDDGRTLQVQTDRGNQFEQKVGTELLHAIRGRRRATKHLQREQPLATRRRSGESALEWLSRLRTSDDGRSKPTRAALEAAAENPASRVIHRVVAALALRPHDEGEALENLDDLATTLTDETLAGLLQQLANGDEPDPLVAAIDARERALRRNAG